MCDFAAFGSSRWLTSSRFGTVVYRCLYLVRRLAVIGGVLDSSGGFLLCCCCIACATTVSHAGGLAVFFLGVRNNGRWLVIPRENTTARRGGILLRLVDSYLIFAVALNGRNSLLSSGLWIMANITNRTASMLRACTGGRLCCRVTSTPN